MNSRIMKALCVSLIVLFAANNYFTYFVDAENEIREMYRLYNKNSGEHFYTAKAGERDDLIKIGWQYEGIGWYAPETSDTPVYRLYNKYGGEHHYTVNEAEKNALVKAGWTDEGIGWYSDDNKTVVLYREYNPNARSCNHNYTTNQKEHEALIGMGWNDEGTAWYGIKEGKPSDPTPTPTPTPSPTPTPAPKGCSVEGGDRRCLTAVMAIDEASDYMLYHRISIGFTFGKREQDECYHWFLNDGSAGGGIGWHEEYLDWFRHEIASGEKPLPNYDFDMCIDGQH